MLNKNLKKSLQITRDGLISITKSLILSFWQQIMWRLEDIVMIEY